MEWILISMFPLSSWLGGCYGNVFAYTELWCFSGRSLIWSMQLGWNSVLFGCLERHIPPCNIFKMVKAGSFCVYFLWEKWVQVGLQLKKCVIGWRTVAGSRRFNGLYCDELKSCFKELAILCLFLRHVLVHDADPLFVFVNMWLFEPVVTNRPDRVCGLFTFIFVIFPMLNLRRKSVKWNCTW